MKARTRPGMSDGAQRRTSCRVLLASSILMTVLSTEVRARECLYISDGEIGALTIIDGESEVSIPTGVDGPGNIVVVGSHAYVNHWGCCGSTGRVVEIDLLTRAVGRTFTVGNRNLDLAYANGKLYVPRLSDHTVTTIDLATGESRDIVRDWFPQRVVASADGQTMFVGEQGLGSVFVLDTEADDVVTSFAPDGGITEIAVDGPTLFVAGPGTASAYEEGPNGYKMKWTVAGVGLSGVLEVGGTLSMRRLFSALLIEFGAPMAEIPLDDPQEVTFHYFVEGPGAEQELSSLSAGSEYLYATGLMGLYRFSLTTAEIELLRKSLFFARVHVDLCPGDPTSTPTRSATPSPSVTPSPSPTNRSPLDGDADCSGDLTIKDVDVTIAAVYDPVARARCDANCNRDARVNAADVTCSIRAIVTRPEVSRFSHRPEVDP